MKRRTGVCFLALLGLVMASSASAHHNMSALFDFNDRVTLNGTMTKLEWLNPHIYVFVDAKGAGDAAEAWSVEGPSPGFFRTREINKSEFESAIGKAVTLEASRARDGSKSGLLRIITLPGGKVISLCPQNC
jgi:uncharacterized protein DUF6152